MIVAVILICGGGPSNGRYNEYWGARTWYEPGAFINGFRGFCAVFVTAAFSFAGTELVGLAAAESANPVKALPGAIKQVFWRITLFFLLGLGLVGMLVAADDPKLLGAENPYADGASPFVLAANHAGLTGFDSFINVVILISVMSIGVSCVYGGSRTLTALAQEGYAPKIFTFVDKSGRPMASVAVHLIAGALAYIQNTSTGEEVFNWFLSLSGLAALFTWGSICLAHIRFRKAWLHHGHTLDEIPFQAIFGVTGSWIGLSLCGLVLAATLFSAIAPPRQTELATAYQFFSAWLTVPVILFFWAVGYIWKRQGWVKIADIDVEYGRRHINWEAINAFREEQKTWPAWRRVFHKIF
jgi:amino acid transporter